MLLSIQYLRGVSALMVVYFHIAGYITIVSGHALPLTTIGSLGVDIFFVISGTVMWISTERRVEPLSFLRKRLIRIVPLYWFVTILVAAGASLRPDSQYSLSHLLSSLLFFPWINPYWDRYYPILVPGWTLNYEMMFYVIFAFTLFLPHHFRLGAVITALGALSVLGTTSHATGVLGFYANPIILEFGAGTLIGAIYMSNVRVSHAAAGATFAIGVVLLFGLGVFANLPRFSSAGIPATLIVGGLIMLEKKRGFPNLPLLSQIGDASYSIYLTHIITLRFITILWMILELDAKGWKGPLFYCIVLVATTVLGFTAYRLIEKPLTTAARMLWPEPEKILAKG